jgi:hypothetical protein
VPDDIETLERMNAVFDMVRSLPFQPNLWKVQNVYYELTQALYPKVAARADRVSRDWAEQFERLGEKLGVVLQKDLNHRSPTAAIA